MSDTGRTAGLRWRRVRFLTVYAAALFFMAVLVLELGARFILRGEGGAPIETIYLQDLVNTYDPLLMWRLTPNLHEARHTGPPGPAYWEASVNTDARGLRVVPGSDPASPARILALGDSTVFGVGSHDGGAWPAQLQARLAAENRGPWSVLNGGVPGYSIVQGMRFLQSRHAALQPLFMLACFGHNDLVPLEAAGGVRDITWRRCESRSALVRLAGHALHAWAVARSNPWGAPDLRVTPGEFIDAARAMIAFCRAEGITPVFILWPFITEVEQGGYMALGQALRAICESEGVVFIDLLPVFQPVAGDIYIDPVHVNAEGNRIAADAIYGQLAAAFPASFAAAPGGAPGMEGSHD